MQKKKFFSIGVTLYKKLLVMTQKIKNSNAFREDFLNLYM